MLSDVRAVLPEALLLVTALVVLVAGSFSPRTRQWPGRVVTAVGLLSAAVVAVVDLADPPATMQSGSAFEGTFALGTATGVGRIIAILASLLIVLLAGDEVRDHPRESEVYVLLLLSTTGVLVVGGAADLLLLAVGFLLASIPLYGLVGVIHRPASAEAALKAYLMGALFGIFLLLGVTVLWGIGGVTTYGELRGALAQAPSAAVAGGGLLVLAGLLFEAGGVPAHFWVPDAVQGSSSTAATYLSTVPKIGALVAAYRLVEQLPGPQTWAWLVAVLATASMTLGNLAAYAQRDPRRLLGWSTVSQVGYALVPVSVAGHTPLALPSLLLYLAAYAVTNIGAFAVVAALPQWRTLESYRGLSRSRPWLAGSLLVVLLGLLGTPPAAIFVGKLTTASAAWDGGFAWLAIVVLLNTVLSLFYYLRWIVPAFQPAVDGDRPQPVPWAAATAVAAAVISLLLGAATGLLWPHLVG
ncbi:NADH-quinone oxidoreductase subunit N [Cumulibacter manganitolerans]|uniref:NADH-quinone oxidoreductase subunit N n=1 Tax=Cumulibacter manganitolerans TaxID=1884992 RepID=UPI001885E18D|nr:proton-conducting transporter membrane subunit [Cumulibacter manganitolerans]